MIFTQSKTREATSTNTATLDKKHTVTLGCTFLCGELVPSAGLEAGAILVTGGKGGSTTSELVKDGSGARAGGNDSEGIIP